MQIQKSGTQNYTVQITARGDTYTSIAHKSASQLNHPSEAMNDLIYDSTQCSAQSVVHLGGYKSHSSSKRVQLVLQCY